jgi:thioredoxin-like negative regulator of GroEL
MLTPSRFACLAVTGTLFMASAAQAQEAKSSTMIRTVKYAGLAEAVASHKGKVVLVDFWHTT